MAENDKQGAVSLRGAIRQMLRIRRMTRWRAMQSVRNGSACEQAPSRPFRPVCAPLVETRNFQFVGIMR